jgi:hypothetical protein
MTENKNWPKPGDKLIHRFRKTSEFVEAEVVSVDKPTGKVSVLVDGVEYGSLSGAATYISGHPSNGWIYWGLKKQITRGKNPGYLNAIEIIVG